MGVCVNKITFRVLLTLSTMAFISQFYHCRAGNSHSNLKQKVTNKQEQLVLTSNCLIKLLTYTHGIGVYVQIHYAKIKRNFINRSLLVSFCRPINSMYLLKNDENKNSLLSGTFSGDMFIC